VSGNIIEEGAYQLSVLEREHERPVAAKKSERRQLEEKNKARIFWTLKGVHFANNTKGPG